MGAPVRFQKAVPGLKENAAVERRKARRSALWAGSPSRWRDRLCRKAGQRVRRSAPANFGAPLPSFRDCEGFELKIWHASPPGCAARQRSRTAQQCTEKTTMPRLKKTTPIPRCRAEVKRDCFAEPVIRPAKGRSRWLAMTGDCGGERQM